MSPQTAREIIKILKDIKQDVNELSREYSLQNCLLQQDEDNDDDCEMLFNREDSEQMVPQSTFKSKSNFVTPTLSLDKVREVVHDSEIFCHSPKSRI